MSFYKDFIHTNFTSSYETQTQQNSVSSSRSSNISRLSDQVLDVSNSTLEPTAQEFHPANQSQSTSGAIKKTFRNERNHFNNPRRSKNNRYGSGRTFNGPKNDSFNRKEKLDKCNLDNYESLQGFLSNEPYSDNFLDNGTNFNRISKGKVHQNQLETNNFGRHSRYQSNKQYGHRSGHRNIKGDHEVSNLEDASQAFENCNKKFSNSSRTYENSNKNNYNKYERNGSFYEKSSSDKYRRTNDNVDKNLSYSYSDRRHKSSLGKVDQFENQNYKGQRKDYDVSLTDFRSGFKPIYNKNNATTEGKSRKDWRSGNSDKHSKAFTAKITKKFDAASQRERLEEMLHHRILECLVCCEKIRQIDKIWSCSQCYHILHLHCVAAWATSSKIENGWRCPACQNVCTEIPKQYKCYCGKTVDPKYDVAVIPHGCGNVCLRKGRTCEHNCTILCHPGPCPDCDVMVSKSCGCGSTQQIVKCGTDIEIVCNSTCNKILNCGIHNCKSICHSGNCQSCSETIKQECYCGKQGRKVTCSSEYSGKSQYSCEDTCEKTLSCGYHKCKKICHDGLCDTCNRDIDVVTTCPCGKTLLKETRITCLDPIPCCDKICGKLLNCGQPSLPHRCREKCHEGDCPKCPLTTVVRCRCGHMDKELPCQQLTTKADDARCEKKCTKKRTCGKHKCNQRCCIEIDHFCPLPCNRQLSCGQHRCERTCHSGRCPPCMETSFEELYCECGTSVLYPPIPCGTKPPPCSKPCSRQRPCGHDANHNCHTGPCPPCTILCKRWCHGNHQQRSAIPCHQENFSCGLPCGKPMPCGRHKCNKPCHEADCPLPCKQPCLVERTLCGHPCGRPCHDPPCPESNCKQNVPVTCACGLQKSTKPCLEVADEFRNLEMARLKEKIGNFSKDQSVDISDICKSKKPTILKILECTEECRVLERNRRLAIGLQIRNPDLSQKLTPKYTDFMKQWAKKDPNFCQKVHEKLTELVQLAKQSKQKSRSYSFETMNRDKRHFVHEYCEHFGIESAAYDAEPNRNIVATATKDKSWLPSMSLLEIIQRENGQRKIPGPSVLGKNTPSKHETVSLRLPSQSQRSNVHQGELIDYFDPPE